MTVPCLNMRSIMSRPVIRAICTRPAKNFASRVQQVRAEAEEKVRGHDTGSQEQPQIDDDFRKEIEAYKTNEANAPRLTSGEELKNLVNCQKYATVCTFSSTGPTKGYPSGALTPYAVDEKGRVLCCLSNLSSHKKDLQENGRATFVVVKEGFASMADSRCTLTGSFKQVPDEEKAQCRELYLEKHPDAYWVDFGDFDYMRMEEVVGCNLIAGFGRATKVSADQYWEAAIDPVAQFSKPICSHMNDDHSDATKAIIKHVAGLTVDSAELLGVDRLGLNVQCRPTRAPQNLVNVRLPFPEPAENRKAVKDQIVAMTRAAAAAGSGAAEGDSD